MTERDPEERENQKMLAADQTVQARTDTVLYKWQASLLPFIIRMLVAFSLVFFVGSFIQLYYLHKRINSSPGFTLGNSFSYLSRIGQEAHGLNQDLIAAARWQTLSVLEASALQRRYHQANVLLMSRVWITYLGFVTGMILALVGAVFVLGKFRESTTKSGAEGGGIKFSIETASPGLVLVGLGSLLMFTTMVTHYDIDVKDGPSYIDQWGTYSQVTVGNQSKPETLPPKAGTARDEDSIIDTTSVTKGAVKPGVPCVPPIKKTTSKSPASTP